jgi:hypothetical protein
VYKRQDPHPRAFGLRVQNATISIYKIGSSKLALLVFGKYLMVVKFDSFFDMKSVSFAVFCYLPFIYQIGAYSVAAPKAKQTIV